jgi:hypothetical protein
MPFFLFAYVLYVHARVLPPLYRDIFYKFLVFKLLRFLAILTCIGPMAIVYSR